MSQSSWRSKQIEVSLQAIGIATGIAIAIAPISSISIIAVSRSMRINEPSESSSSALTPASQSSKMKHSVAGHYPDLKPSIQTGLDVLFISYLFMLHACINSNINIETSLAPQQPPMTKGSFPKTPQPTSGTTITSASKTLGQLLSKEDYNNSLIYSHVAMHTSKCLRLSAWINDFHFGIFAYQICITVIGRHWSHTA